MNFSEPVEIPGLALPAGTYWFVLADSQGNQQIVQVFSTDRKTIYATEQTVPAERLHATSRVELNLPERPHQLPEALLKWYFQALDRAGIPVPAENQKGLMRDARQDVMAAPLKLKRDASHARRLGHL